MRTHINVEAPYSPAAAGKIDYQVTVTLHPQSKSQLWMISGSGFRNGTPGMNAAYVGFGGGAPSGMLKAYALNVGEHHAFPTLFVRTTIDAATTPTVDVYVVGVDDDCCCDPNDTLQVAVVELDHAD